MTITSISQTANNKYALYGDDAAWDNAMKVYTTTSAGTDFFVGTSTGYYVYRGYPVFSLSAISDTITRAAVQIKLYGGVGGVNEDTTIYLCGYSGASLTEDNAGYCGVNNMIFGSFDTEDYSVGDVVAIELNDAGIDYLNNRRGEEFCCLSLIGKQDYLDTASTTDYRIHVYTVEHATEAYRPLLFVETEDDEEAEEGDHILRAPVARNFVAGSTVLIRSYITSKDNEAADPGTSVKITITDSDGTVQETDMDMTKTASGVYDYLYVLASDASSGIWTYTVTGIETAGYVTKAQGSFEVKS